MPQKWQTTMKSQLGACLWHRSFPLFTSSPSLKLQCNVICLQANLLGPTNWPLKSLHVRNNSIVSPSGWIVSLLHITPSVSRHSSRFSPTLKFSGRKRVFSSSRRSSLHESKKICEKKKKKAWCWHAVWNSTFRAPHPQSLARRANINFFLFSLIFYLAQRTSPKKRDCSLSIFLVTILPMKRERGSIRVKCQKAQYKWVREHKPCRHCNSHRN